MGPSESLIDILFHSVIWFPVEVLFYLFSLISLFRNVNKTSIPHLLESVLDIANKSMYFLPLRD